jgi:hypothetical protein
VPDEGPVAEPFEEHDCLETSLDRAADVASART